MTFMNDRLVDLNFSRFIGLEVKEIKAAGIELFAIIGSNFEINIECTWRIRDKSKILIGISDRPKNPDLLLDVNKLLINRLVSNIYLFEATEDLSIEFNDGVIIDMFNDGTTCESFQIYFDNELIYIGR
jgi:hypothetical protein